MPTYIPEAGKVCRTLSPPYLHPCLCTHRYALPGVRVATQVYAEAVDVGEGIHGFLHYTNKPRTPAEVTHEAAARKKLEKARKKREQQEEAAALAERQRLLDEARGALRSRSRSRSMSMAPDFEAAPRLRSPDAVGSPLRAQTPASRQASRQGSRTPTPGSRQGARTPASRQGSRARTPPSRQPTRQASRARTPPSRQPSKQGSRAR